MKIKNIYWQQLVELLKALFYLFFIIPPMMIAALICYCWEKANGER
jgi:hypothetical protein